MKVTQLIQFLSACDPDSEVLVTQVQQDDRLHSIKMVNTATPGLVLLDFDYLCRDDELFALEAD